jgi:alpha-aminoadipic semialdehyde synthase
MVFTLGIRREDKSKWERRVPITPEHVKELREKFDIKTVVQPSKIRTFTDKEYENSGAMVSESLSPSSVVFAVKEIPVNLFEKGKTYVFFSHTVKGQKHNMPMLKKMMDLGCNLIDYEKIADERGRRLVFFGHYAGLAGMIDSLWVYGQRMKSKGINTPFIDLKQAIHYRDLDEARDSLEKISNRIEKEGLPDSVSPMVVGFAGYGNVSKGAQEIIDVLPIKEISPKEFNNINQDYSNKVIYKAVFKEEDMVEPISSDKKFDLQEYYNHPELYRSIFKKYLPDLSILMNCIYWDKRYPRLVTREFMKKNYSNKMKLQVIGDISVDINGAVEFTEKTTTQDNPVFVYNPIKDEITDGYTGDGVVVLAVDNLPCELPRESSREFGDILLRFIPLIIQVDFSVEFNNLQLPPEIKKAVILHQGKLTPNYQYMDKFL